LADDRVHPLSPHLTAPLNQLCIVRGDHHRGKPTDVVGQTSVELVVAFELLFGTSLDAATHTLFHIQALKITLHQHEGLAMRDVLGIDGVEITLAKAQIMDGIENIGLSTSVVAKEAIHLRTQLQICTSVVFEVNQMKMFESHGANFLFLTSVTQISWRRKRIKKTLLST
jgi:hypothetical protein